MFDSLSTWFHMPVIFFFFLLHWQFIWDHSNIENKASDNHMHSRYCTVNQNIFLNHNSISFDKLSNSKLEVEAQTMMLPSPCFTDGRQLLLYLSSDFNICAYSGWFEPKMFNLNSFATYYQFSSCLWHTSTFSPCFPSLKLASDSHPSTETLSDECLVNSWRAYRIFAVLYYYLWLLFIPIFNNMTFILCLCHVNFATFIDSVEREMEIFLVFAKG